MKTKLTLLLLIGVNLLLNSGCEKVVERSELNLRNGKYYPVNSNTPYTGRIVHYHEMFNFTEIGSYKNGKRNGLKETYYENGQLRSSQNYKHGKLNGLWESYYENGQLKYSANWKGSFYDKSYTYYENGQLKSLENYQNIYGFPSRLNSSKYYENGQLKSSENYNYGKLDGLFEKYDENGQLTFSGIYKEGKLVTEHPIDGETVSEEETEQ